MQGNALIRRENNECDALTNAVTSERACFKMTIVAIRERILSVSLLKKLTSKKDFSKGVYSQEENFVYVVLSCYRTLRKPFRHQKIKI
jgi:hypothetical protein